MTTTRKLLEQDVCAWNICLKETAPTMDLVILLRNSHPIYRAAFASKLLDEKQISKHAAAEFLKFV